MKIVFPILFDIDLTSFTLMAMISLPHATITICKDAGCAIDICEKFYICRCKLICSEKMYITDIKKFLFDGICIKLSF